MRDIWDQLRGSEVMIEADEDELVDWALAHSRQFIEQQGAPSDDEDDEDADDDAEDVIDEEEY